MSGFELWLSGHDSMSGTLMLLFWAAGVVTALVIVVGMLAYRDFAMRDMIDIFLRTAGVLAVVMLGWVWLDHSTLREHAAERRALELRESELTARAVAPGSALACLDQVGNEAVETGCEQAVFASPQAIAAAIAYVDAKLTLLADELAYAGRGRGRAGELERARRALEADRFGAVAQVLASRGCSSEDCAAFKLFKDASRVKANLKERAFEGHVRQYAASWMPSNAAVSGAASSAPPLLPTVSLTPSVSTTPTVSKFSFPSSASIPPVSIMTAEPTGSTSPDNASADQPAAVAKKPPVRRQPASKPPVAQNRLPPPPTASPPIATVGPTAPAQ